MKALPAMRHAPYGLQLCVDSTAILQTARSVRFAILCRLYINLIPDINSEQHHNYTHNIVKQINPSILLHLEMVLLLEEKRQNNKTERNDRNIPQFPSFPITSPRVSNTNASLSNNKQKEKEQKKDQIIANNLFYGKNKRLNKRF